MGVARSLQAPPCVMMESNKTVRIKYKVNYSLLLLSLQPLNRKRLHDLVREVDPNQTLDEDAEEVRRGWEDCRIYHNFTY